MSIIYAIDTDWAWYYFSCRSCNKKVTHIRTRFHAVESKPQKPKFWCDVCRSPVTNVVPRYMIYVKVMDNTSETKFLLFDSIASEVIGKSATSILGGSLDEITNAEDLPEAIKNVIGKIFVFLVCVERENIWDGKDSYRVTKILSKDGLLAEQITEESNEILNPSSFVSGDQVHLALTYSQETSESTTPSSKRVYASNSDTPEQSSSSKKVCAESIQTADSIKKFDVKVSTLEFGEKEMEEGIDLAKTTETPMCKMKDNHVGNIKTKGVQIKVEKK
ncbi:PREDICTED: uncharacterized protein LOC104751038 [Camelina sativa]|uniref:Uncharacterized protein LOC104751038 n=1 Tax=Camelina sativa TaxID=90675 RepID=A0ABM0WHN2_CAMSA|nr:PREDICTED: uncharacterized protein LOC104751038 [Camelina sativa]